MGPRTTKWILGGALLGLGMIGASFALTREPRPIPRAYVTNEEAGTVTVIDIESNRVVATIPVGKRPRGVQVSPDGKTVYVALTGSPRVAPGQREDLASANADKSADGIGVIDAATNTLRRGIVGGSDPEQFAVGENGTTLYVANEDAAELSVIDVASNAVRGKVAVGNEPEGVTLSPDGRMVWVTREADNKVFVVDVKSLGTVAAIDVGARPRSTALSKSGKRAYVTLENAASLAIIDATTHRVERTVKYDGQNVRPMGVVISPDEQTIYVTTGRGRSVLVLSAEDGSVRTRVEVGERPWGIAITHDGKKLFTANGTSDDVSVIDATQNAVVATLKVGGRPWGIAVYP